LIPPPPEQPQVSETVEEIIEDSSSASTLNSAPDTLVHRTPSVTT